jgi:hypothetical protein
MVDSLRPAIITGVIAVTLLLPAAAQAHSSTASAGGVKATLSYSGGPGITTRDERLKIVQGGRVVYDQPVPTSGCAKVCGPGAKQPVAVADLYGNDGEDVVLTLFSGGADCCSVANVYVPSAAVQSYVLDQHNFGEAGFVLKDIGPKGRPEFVSADASFYCVFTDCAASAMPLQIDEFDAERFVDVTKRYPKLVAADASRWLEVYTKNPSQGISAIVAWAADEDNLGLEATVRTVFQRQIADGHLKSSFVASAERFLAKHNYS